MKSLLNTLLLVTAMLTLTACLGPGYRTTNMNGHKRVYHVDEEGNKRLIYEVDKTGKTIGHVKDDPQYKQHMAQIAHQQKQQEAALEKQKELEQAEKRSATDPIYVYLEKIKNGPGHTSKDPKKQKQIEKTVNNIEARIKKELSSHKLIKLTDNTNKADIIVDITVDMKKKTMVNRKTMKTGEVPMIVFTSNSENVYSSKGHKLKHEDFYLTLINTDPKKNPINQYAKLLADSITNKIGPQIPKEREKYRPTRKQKPFTLKFK